MADQDTDKAPAATRAKRAAPHPVLGKGTPPAARDTLAGLAKPAKKGSAEDKGKPQKDAKRQQENRSEPLNFRVTPEFRRAFKRAAADQDCKKVELLERIFASWAASQPKTG